MKAGWALAALIFLGGPASAQTLMLRSDLPLWSEDSGNMVWPRAFHDGNDFGCASAISGRYALTETDVRGQAEASEQSPAQPDQWVTLKSTGVIHCMLAMTTTTPGDPDRTNDRGMAFLVELGHVSDTDPRGLFALQIGMMGGSEYWLMAGPSPTTLRGAFDILDIDCVHGNRRSAALSTAFRTEYCVINDRDTLLAEARSAVQRSPRATLRYVDGR